jgi:transcriptional regulator GlxA family with amidase domain
MSKTEGGLRLGILALEGCMLSSVASASDSLRVASKLAEIRLHERAPRLESVIFSARGDSSVMTSAGISLGGLSTVPDDLDVVIVPGMMHSSPHGLIVDVESRTAEIELLRTLHRRGVRIAGACSGTFLLAASGLLDGRPATTSWWLSAAFRQHFPAVRLEADAMLIDDGDLLTSGGACSLQGMMLRLIEGAGGKELAQQTARMLLIDPDRQSQAPYVSQALIDRPRSSLSERAHGYINRELHRELSVASVAEHCGTSERSLLRHFRTEHGSSALEYIQHQRVERAKALLETSHLSFEEIVERCGYLDVSSFRKLFKRATTLTPADYRERFRLRAH